MHQSLPPPVDIIIPFYKHVELVEPLIHALCELASDLTTMRATLILINDSPDDELLKQALDKACLLCETHGISFQMVVNESNLGFLRSTNKGLHAAALSGHDVILLNSDTRPTAASLSELQRVVYSDTQIGFASPRSNNAVHCSFPTQEQYTTMEFEPAFNTFKQLHSCLPPLSYAPTLVGFCLYIKHTILVKIEFLDEIYGHGYYEEYDYIYRGRQHGYQAVLANHAYVYHQGSASIASKPKTKERLQKKNRRIFVKRYPHYGREMRRYLSSPYYKAETLLHGLLKDSQGKRGLVIDLSGLNFLYGKRKELTLFFLKNVIKNSSEQFTIFLKCSRSTWLIQQFYKLENVDFFSKKHRYSCAISCRVVGNTLSFRELNRVSNLAPHNVYILPDTFENTRQKKYWDFLTQYGHSIAGTKRFLESTKLGDVLVNVLSSSDAMANKIVERKIYFIANNLPSLALSKVRQILTHIFQ